jgi:hypothetical protein
MSNIKALLRFKSRELSAFTRSKSFIVLSSAASTTTPRRPTNAFPSQMRNTHSRLFVMTLKKMAVLSLPKVPRLRSMSRIHNAPNRSSRASALATIAAAAIEPSCSCGSDSSETRSRDSRLLHTSENHA